MDKLRYEPYVTPAQLERMFPGAHSAEEIRAFAHREVNPLPHIERGAKRKVMGIRESVYALFLGWEEGLITYDEVVEGARRHLEGVR